MQAAREYEAHSFGAVAFDWRGVTSNPPCGIGGNDIVVRWDPSLTNACGQMLRWGYFCNDGRLGLSATRQFNLTTATQPPTGISTRCVDLRATILHELAHYVRATNDHPLNSVLTGNVPVGDLVSRNLWNEDMIAASNIPRRPVLLLLERYNDGNGSSISAGGTMFAYGENFTGSVSQGGPGFQYARVHAPNHGFPRVVFEQGDGQGPNWGHQRILSNATFWGSYHRTCVVVHPWGNDVYVLWVNGTQQPLMNDQDPSVNAGSRQVVFVESHDGGQSFTTPQALGALRTRTGLSCTYDPFTQRVVAVVADPVEQLMVVHRPIAAGGAWSTPTPLNRPFTGSALRTADTPLVSFDAYSSDNYGLVTWWDSDDNDQRAMYIRYFPSIQGYSFDSAFLPWISTPVVEEQLFSSVVPNMIAGSPHWALNTQLNGLLGKRRFRRIQGVLNESFELISSTGLDIYTGSAANRLFIETAYMRHLISN